MQPTTVDHDAQEVRGRQQVTGEPGATQAALQALVAPGDEPVSAAR
jgi:hypothetical protein